MKIPLFSGLLLFLICSCTSCPYKLDTSDILSPVVTKQRIALINSFDTNNEKERDQLLSLLEWDHDKETIGFMGDETMTSIIAYIANGRHQDAEAWKALKQMQLFMDGEWGGMDNVLFYELDLSGIPGAIWLKHILYGENITYKEHIERLLEREKDMLKYQIIEEEKLAEKTKAEDKEYLEGTRRQIRYLKCMIAHFEKRKASLD